MNADAVTFSGGPYDLIVSISTLEHVGYDEEPRDAGKAVRAIREPARPAGPGGELLATIPVGYNRVLDDALREGSLAGAVTYLARLGELRWKQVERDDMRRDPRMAVAGSGRRVRLAVAGRERPRRRALAISGLASGRPKSYVLCEIVKDASPV